jgi:hypothetical protein
MLADRAPRRTGPGEGLVNKFLCRVLITDTRHDGAQAFIGGPAVEIREIQWL